MLISLIIILILAFSGFALTYLFADEETFLWRIAAGNIIGAAIFGTLGFVIANFAGLSIVTVLVALVISALPLDFIFKKRYSEKIQARLGQREREVAGRELSADARFCLLRFFLYSFLVFL